MANQTRLTLELNGFADLGDILRGGMQQEFFHGVTQALTTIALRVRDTAKERVISGRGYGKAPFQTGRMYKSITMRQDSIYQATVYPTVSYAVYPHEGLSTSKSYGRRPFMEDAVTDNESFTENELASALEASFGKIAGKVNT